mmetsp:Transcript_55590/g.153935  ORF Transcript_55590/g.153935 Transcript_55590/m.153935 type:complete len:138 (+) Transcript_55590:63-476(+)
MMSDASLPVMNKPVNMMEAGPNGNNLQAQAMQRHPVEELQRQQASQRVYFLGTDEEEEVRRLYGSGFAMKLATERRAAQDTIMPTGGIPTSNLMHDILTGNDMKLGFEDVLNLPQHRPLFVKHHEDPHAMMERKLGM